LGKALLVKAKTGDLTGIEELMMRGAPFIQDWVSKDYSLSYF
jgi:hypothetical protein